MTTLYYNGTIYTMAAQMDTVDNVLVENGYITAVNTGHEQADEIIDLKGGTMLPALTDTHMHLVMLGKKLKSLVLYDDTDIAEVKQKIGSHSSARKWDLILGYDENNFADQYRITKDELDVITDKPTVVARVCQHAGVVNQQAFDALGIGDDVEDPEGGYYERDRDGSLTGWVYDNAFNRFRSAQVDDDEGTISDDLTVAAKHLQSLGIANAHTEDMSSYGPYEVPLNGYLKTFGPDKVKFRVNLLRNEQVYKDMVAAAPEYIPDWIEKDAMKIFADGAFGGKTALLKEPYEGSDGHGLQIHDQKELEERIQWARANGDAVAVHVIGDKAVEMVLDAIEKYPVADGEHDRLIHVSLVNENLLERMAQLDVICDVQPTFLTSDMPWVAEYIGEDRSRHLYVFKTMQDKGLLLGGSSDAPIEDVNPLLGVHTLLTRRGNTDVYNEGEVLDRHSAFAMYTKNAAEIVNRGRYAGMIKPGYLADFVIFDNDVMAVEADDLLNVKVNKTIIDGEVVYKR